MGLYGCAGGVIVSNDLSWVSIGDCFVSVFSSSGELKFVSPDGLENFQSYISKHSAFWRDPKRRIYIRSQFRNNPQQIINGRCAGYGALTGEKNAEYFIKSGRTEVSSGDIIIFYTDGFGRLTKNRNAFSYLKTIFYRPKNFLVFDQKLAKSNYGTFGRERTLIAILN